MKTLKETILIGLGIISAVFVFAVMVYIAVIVYDISYVMIIDAVSGRIDACITVNGK